MGAVKGVRGAKTDGGIDQFIGTLPKLLMLSYLHMKWGVIKKYDGVDKNAKVLVNKK